MKAALALFAGGLLMLGVAVLKIRAGVAASGSPTADERRAAVDTVRMMLALTAHLRGSGGDPRFAERIPAAPPVLEELQRDLAFTNHLGAVEDAQLVRLEARNVRRVAPGRIEVDTKEFWVTRTSAPDRERSGVRSDVVQARYVVGRQPGGWIVMDWELAPGMAPSSGGG